MTGDGAVLHMVQVSGTVSMDQGLGARPGGYPSLRRHLPRKLFKSFYYSVHRLPVLSMVPTPQTVDVTHDWISTLKNGARTAGDALWVRTNAVNIRVRSAGV